MYVCMAESKVINLDRPKESDGRYQCDWMPKWPFRYLIVGGTGAGKTNAILNGVLRGWIDFDTLIVCAGDVEEEKYDTLREWCDATAADRDELIREYDQKYKNVEKKNRPTPPQPFRYLFIDNIESLPSINDFESVDKLLKDKKVKDPRQMQVVIDEINSKQILGSDEDSSPLLLRDWKTRRTLVLVDDMINELYQGPINRLYSQGRKKNISIAYITQSFFKVPDMIRKNVTQYMFFGGLTPTNVRNTSEGVSVGLDPKEFLSIYRAATLPTPDDTNPFLHVDLLEKKPGCKIKRNFDQVLG